MRPRRAVLVVVLIGLLLLAGVFGFFLNRYQIFEKGVIINQPKNFQAKLDTSKIKTIQESIPNSPVKGIKIQLHEGMPLDSQSIDVWNKEAVFGPDGTGVGCVKPVWESEGVTAVINIYLTRDKLINKYGEQEANRIVDGVIKLCVARMYMGESLTDKQKSALMKQINDQVNGLEVLREL